MAKNTFAAQPRNKMIRSVWPPALLGLCCCVAVMGSPARVLANAGPSSTSAQIVAEPMGIDDVRISHETLTIDLRPVTTGEEALVEAVYNLHNDGPERTLDLLFAFGSPENSGYSVTLDNQPITGVLKRASLPKAWMPPAFTPGLDGSAAPSFGDFGSIQPLSFSIDVPAGPSVLAVSYRTQVKHAYARPNMLRQFAYILAPARSWAGFGGLDVQILVPDDWEVASTPALQRDGSLLQGSFDDIPADAIAVTLRPPVPFGYLSVKRAAWALYGAVWIAGLVWCWRWGRRSVSRESELRLQQRQWRAGIVRVVGSALIGLAFGLVIFGAGMVAAWGADTIFPPSAAELARVNYLGLSDGYASLATSAGVLLLSFVACVVVFAITQRRR